MAHVQVKRAFPYAHDHINVRMLKVGDTVEIDDGVIAGLIHAGYVERTVPTTSLAEPAAEPAKKKRGA